MYQQQQHVSNSSRCVCLVLLLCLWSLASEGSISSMFCVLVQKAGEVSVRDTLGEERWCVCVPHADAGDLRVLCW